MPCSEKWRSRPPSPTALDTQQDSPLAAEAATTAESMAETTPQSALAPAGADSEVEALTSENIVFEALQNLLHTGSFNRAAQIRLQEVCANIDASESAALVTYIDDHWKAEWASLPEF